ncbi:hypothetical protein SRABI64_03884 [Pseudomonas carnis]|uniref:Uncharacterized protein n=1 Tax=Pseudomonas fluorescens TaxID=294 RepID=A0A109LFM1_PSEFL|nr:hypothetical protein PFLmoz3_03622 [Pseudomonas fluorescens]CAH0284982.1 hypothetical protein SRABI64_03884 [Pseudomonas carnis]
MIKVVPLFFGWANVYTQAVPHYQLLIESYIKAQEVANNHEVLDSQRK